MKTNPIPKEAAKSLTIYDSYAKAKSVLDQHDRAICSISGGKDSDIVLDIIWRLDAKRKVKYVWFNTGIEYEATRRHLKDLEDKYQIGIERARPVKSVPACCHEYGQPVISKLVSETIERAQKYGFRWEDKPIEELRRKYTGRCGSVLRWWCNDFFNTKAGKFLQWSIGYNKGLKEFIIENPPDFKVSSKCCAYAKKKAARLYEQGADLKITGIRRAEGGVRSANYTNCFSHDTTIDAYRPLFWYLDKDVKEYSDAFGIRHSDCYEVYGLKRTGCVGCPYNRRLAEEMRAIETYEPALAKVCKHVFKDSYAYTQKYKKFVAERFVKGSREMLPSRDAIPSRDTIPFGGTTSSGDATQPKGAVPSDAAVSSVLAENPCASCAGGVL